MASNPLQSRKPAAPADHPAKMHAHIWQHVQGMDADTQATKATQLSYGLPILGALASNPKTTRKDVIKAAADAAGVGKLDPSQAVAMISQMPDDPDKLQPWLKGLYATNLSAMVHLKAAQMPEPAAPQPGVPQQ